MFPEERRAWLLAKARNEGRVNVADTATHLEVAQETVRRDLDELEAKGLLRRVHGGAIPVEGSLYEAPLWERRTKELVAKQAIAECITERLRDVQTVFLDEGSTGQVIAEVWNPTEQVTVVTAALQTALTMAAKPQVSLFFLGGRVRSNTLAVADPTGRIQLADMVVDVAILGTNGVSITHGCTCPDNNVAAMKSAALVSAREAWLATDSTKLGATSFRKFAAITQFTYLFTDKSADPMFVKSIEDLGVKVVTA